MSLHEIRFLRKTTWLDFAFQKLKIKEKFWLLKEYTFDESEKYAIFLEFLFTLISFLAATFGRGMLRSSSGDISWNFEQNTADCSISSGHVF